MFHNRKLVGVFVLRTRCTNTYDQKIVLMTIYPDILCFLKKTPLVGADSAMVVGRDGKNKAGQNQGIPNHLGEIVLKNKHTLKTHEINLDNNTKTVCVAVIYNTYNLDDGIQL